MNDEPMDMIDVENAYAPLYEKIHKLELENEALDSECQKMRMEMVNADWMRARGPEEVPDKDNGEPYSEWCIVQKHSGRIQYAFYRHEYEAWYDGLWDIGTIARWWPMPPYMRGGEDK